MKINEILNHPILMNQIKEASFVIKYANDILNILKKKRPDVINEIIIDIIIKLFRIYICGDKNCINCKQCLPNIYMTENKFKEFIKNKKIDIIEIIEQGFNNSFNIPQRGILVQYIIDKLIGINDNLIVFEIGCGGGLIGKVLINSNYSKKFFKCNLNIDNRFVQYYGIDPNLLIDHKMQLMMINGNSGEMQICRKILCKFNNDNNFKIDDFYLDKLYLNEINLNKIEKKIKELISKFNKNYENQFVILTSFVKYHFKYKYIHNEFMQKIFKLSKLLEKNNCFKNIYYISNEACGINGGLYPFENKKFHKIVIKSNKIVKGNLVNEIIYPELNNLEIK